jgi:hypothetical protein
VAGRTTVCGEPPPQPMRGVEPSARRLLLPGHRETPLCVVVPQERVRFVALE